jgi:hypothetical protein
MSALKRVSRTSCGHCAMSEKCQDWTRALSEKRHCNSLH